MIKYTNETAFAAIVEFFSRPGAQLAKTGSLGLCHYRHPDNPAIRCAVGCLIPDTEYRVDFESKGIDEIYTAIPSLWGVSSELLLACQCAHDESDTVHDFLKALENIKENMEIGLYKGNDD